jgi:hypothetical protein
VPCESTIRRTLQRLDADALDDLAGAWAQQRFSNLGHTEVRDVYWYLSAVPEPMSIVAGRFEAFAGHDAAHNTSKWMPWTCT